MSCRLLGRPPNSTRPFHTPLTLIRVPGAVCSRLLYGSAFMGSWILADKIEEGMPGTEGRQSRWAAEPHRKTGRDRGSRGTVLAAVLRVSDSAASSLTLSSCTGLADNIWATPAVHPSQQHGAGEMSHQLKVLATLLRTRVWSPAPTWLTTSCNPISKGSGLTELLLVCVHTHVHTKSNF